MSIDSQKHNDKMISYMGIYVIFVGFLLLIFSTFIYNIKFSNSPADGIVLSWIIMGSGLFSTLFYGIKSHFSKNK